ncbi:NB-ARC domain-containing protein [Dictyobacter aurantiacus]|uniref:HTH cro/C1-type domain-containing protein n=1 Tax=Dictyobacter aurantiacus TaxID=1936993 RepID=A0A401ZSE1_9CHLR|nr:NB-ARC domain-containing protein [Dictyobacter aurantiacus]GCE09781.1 hypothetical protein KDAU_71100 [Dictyobacter aurantiacus]
MSNLAFGPLLRFYRRRAQLTQEDLAGKSGYGANYVSMIERGVRSPTGATAQALAKALDLNGQEYDQFIITATEQRKATSLSPLTLHEVNQEDWGEIPHTRGFQGRQQELADLEQWIVDDSCQIVAVLGIGGIGKTTLTAKLIEQIAGAFHYVYWRTLQHAPPFKAVLQHCIQFLSDQQRIDLPKNDNEQISLLIEYLRKHRCLLVLDNFESVLQAGNRTSLYLPDYEGYGKLLQRVGDTQHQSCLVLTSREKPKEIAQWEGMTSPIRSLYLSGIKQSEGRKILNDKGLFGSDNDWTNLIQLYSGNPLALKLVSEPIRDLFGGDIAVFLKSEDPSLGIQDLLDQQFKRLSAQEKEIMYWLAIEREAVSLYDLQELKVSSLSKGEVLDAMASLRRRSMIEMSSVAHFTLQPVIMEYVTNKFVEQIAEEIRTAKLELFMSHALMKAQAKDYVRDSQKRLILTPLAQSLLFKAGEQESGAKLKDLLIMLRQTQPYSLNYAAGNVLNLLIHLNIDLHNYDFSSLTVWQAYLQGVILQDVNFTSSNLATSVFTDIFGNILSVDFSPNGSLLAGGTSNCEVWVWQASSGIPLLTCRGHPDWAWSVAFSPDGAKLASGSEDKTIRIWEADTGRCLNILYGHIHVVKSIAFSPDGTILASGSSDQTIRLWEVHTGRCLNILQGHTNIVRSVAFSPDGKFLASGGDDQAIYLWELSTGRCLRILQGHEGRIHSVTFSPDSTTLASSSDDRTIRLWKIDTEQYVKILRGHTNVIRSVVFNSDGTILASGSDDQTIRLWEINTEQTLRILQGHSSWVYSVAFSPDGTLLASGSDDHTTRFWNVNTGQCLRTLQGHTNWIKSVTFSPDGTILASGSEDRKVRVWDVNTGQCLRALQGHTNLVRSVAFSPDGTVLASGSDDQTIRIWEPGTGHCLNILQGHTSWVQSVAFSLDGTILASGSDDQTIRIWEPGTGHCLNILQGHTSRVYSVAFSPDGTILASGSDDQSIRFWEISTGRCIQTLRGHGGRVYSVAFSHDGSILASGSGDQTIRLWEVNTFKVIRILQAHSSWVMSVAFNSDDTILASGSEDHTVCVWEASTGRVLRTFKDHTHVIRSIAFGPDRHMLASASHDETIKLWNVLTNDQPKTLISERPYERMNITNVKGLSEAQKTALKVLGAIEDVKM